MRMLQTTDSHSPLSLHDRVEAGEEATQFQESVFWPKLQRAIRGFQDSRSRALMSKEPTNEGASYAHLVGEARGIAAVEKVLNEIVRDGKLAEAEIREAEEEGSS